MTEFCQSPGTLESESAVSIHGRPTAPACKDTGTDVYQGSSHLACVTSP